MSEKQSKKLKKKKVKNRDKQMQKFISLDAKSEREKFQRSRISTLNKLDQYKQ